MYKWVALIVMMSGSLASGAAGSFVPDVPLKEGPVPEQASAVVLEQNSEGGWRLLVNGEPFVMRGAGGATAPGLLEQLVAAGGNCVRTWGIDTLEQKMSTGERYIDYAWRLGIMVVPGLWVQHERHGFNYADEAFVAKQRAEVVQAVRTYRDHPAVLAWGLGNEMEGPASREGSLAVFKEVNELAKLLKAEDPHHPVMTVIAFNPAKIGPLMAYCPEVDILGLNSYGGAAGAGPALVAAGWTKPFAVTEFGVRGFWEVPATPWGAPLEPSSQEKAGTYYATQRLVTELNEGHERCLGTFAFLWGWKQERTSTWFGMFLPTLEKLPQVDAMTKAWTGAWPANRCPKITGLTSYAREAVVEPGRTISAKVDATDPNGDALEYRWMITSESTDHGSGGEAESVPASHPELIQTNGEAECVFITPSIAGNYRLFVTIHDGQGGAATANFPFRVQ